MAGVMERFHLDGKVVLITGGARGMGALAAQTLAQAGAMLVVTDLLAADAEAVAAGIRASGGQAMALAHDVTNEAQWEHAIRESVLRFGGLDVLVNNAGIAGPTAKVEDIDPKDWERCIAIDLNGMFYCTRKAMPMIKAAGGGSIINLSSIAGRLAFPMRTPYAAAKWAVVGFTQSLAAEAGPQGVRVNCIQPGIVEGERVDRIVAAKAHALGVPSETVLEKMVEGVSLKTTVSAQDIANTALFLASDAGKHISGQAISVCGGVRYLV